MAACRTGPVLLLLLLLLLLLSHLIRLGSLP
jgi:hypothetical protein